MSYMFYYMNSLRTADVSNFVTKEVKDMIYILQFCRVLSVIDISNFNTSKVINMKSI